MGGVPKLGNHHSFLGRKRAVELHIAQHRKRNRKNHAVCFSLLQNSGSGYRQRDLVLILGHFSHDSPVVHPVSQFLSERSGQLVVTAAQLRPRLAAVEKLLPHHVLQRRNVIEVFSKKSHLERGDYRVRGALFSQEFVLRVVTAAKLPTRQ
jgi:hypothetical protein